MATEFMTNLMTKLKQDKGLAESTIRQYMRNLVTLNEKKPFDSFAFLKKKKDIDAKMVPYSANTRRSLLSTIVSVLSLVKEQKGFKALYSKYYDDMMNFQVPKQNHEKTEKESENWIDWKDVLKIKEDLASKKDKSWNDALRYIVLCLYTDLQPRRNQDYMLMDVVPKITKDLPTDRNYYGTKEGVFVFNRYKTQKKYGQQVVDVPHSLQVCLKDYLSKHPLKKEKVYPLLVSAKGEPLTTINAITRILNSIFHKKIGASMLRHIFLSSKYDINEMKNDAEVMAHSTEMQKDYLRTDST